MENHLRPDGDPGPRGRLWQCSGSGVITDLHQPEQHVHESIVVAIDDPDFVLVVFHFAHQYNELVHQLYDDFDNVPNDVTEQLDNPADADPLAWEACAEHRIAPHWFQHRPGDQVRGGAAPGGSGPLHGVPPTE